MMEPTLRTFETITHWALASNLQRTASQTNMTCDSWLDTSCPDYLLQAPRDTHVGVCGHIVWCNAKGVGDREILEKYSYSAYKNTSGTDIFPHGPKSLLTSVTASHTLHPYYEMVVLRMQDSLPCEKGCTVEPIYSNISLCDNLSIVPDILLYQLIPHFKHNIVLG